MRQPTSSDLLLAWERGRGRHPLDRGLVLYALAEPEREPDTLADEPLGRRNAALLRLRRALFGDALGACVDCPSCQERLEFSLNASELLGSVDPTPAHVELGDLLFRMPTTRDLARVALTPDMASAAHALFLSLVEGGTRVDAAALARLEPEVATALERADPHLEFLLELSCPPCGHVWPCAFDIEAFLWEEIDARSRRLLDEVHVLARAYGWNEHEILGLSAARRAAYLERALA